MDKISDSILTDEGQTPQAILAENWFPLPDSAAKNLINAGYFRDHSTIISFHSLISVLTQYVLNILLLKCIALN